MGLLAWVKALSGGWVPLGHLLGPQNPGEGHEVRSQALSIPLGSALARWAGAQGSAQPQGRLALGWCPGPPACLPPQLLWAPPSACLSLAPLPPCASPRPLSLFSPPPPTPPGPHLSSLQPRVKGKESIGEFDRIQLHSCR